MGIQYPDFCPMQLDKDGGYYCRHVAAMTDEALFRKSDIAEQLGWRDREIDRLRAELAAKSKDAARYAWLTNPDFGQLSISDVFNAWWRSDNGHPETINDAIDIAMKQDEAAMGEGNGR